LLNSVTGKPDSEVRLENNQLSVKNPNGWRVVYLFTFIILTTHDHPRYVIVFAHHTNHTKELQEVATKFHWVRVLTHHSLETLLGSSLCQILSTVGLD
jgi:hypothetical protein